MARHFLAKCGDIQERGIHLEVSESSTFHKSGSGAKMFVYLSAVLAAVLLAASLILPQTLNISNNFASFVSDIANSPNTPSTP